jgi:hypothetical protein
VMRNQPVADAYHAYVKAASKLLGR